MKIRTLKLPFLVFSLVFILLSLVQVNTSTPLMLAERFMKGAGWIEITLISFYGAVITNKMRNPAKTPKVRHLTWTIFSLIFFAQLAAGLAGSEKFLMTGKLHLPVPFMIIAGPLYRGEYSFMTLLFLSTIIISGPAWCSHLCYFGAFDNLAARGKTRIISLWYKNISKITVLVIVVGFSLLFRWLGISVLCTTICAVIAGLAGIAVMIIISQKKKKMIHCTLFCPVGTLVNYLRFINPTRMYIQNSCTSCMKCSAVCKYDALNPEDITKGKPGITCTYCGDCIPSCPHDSIKYKFMSLPPETARNLYLIITIVLHSLFLALARL